MCVRVSVCVCVCNITCRNVSCHIVSHWSNITDIVLRIILREISKLCLNVNFIEKKTNSNIPSRCVSKQKLITWMEISCG